MDNVTVLACIDELDKIAGLRDAGTWARDQVQGGIRNIGGAISSFATPVASAKAGARQMTKDLKGSLKSPKGLGMAGLQMYGLVSQGRDALRPYDPSGEGRSRLHRTAALVGDQIGGLIGARHGMMGQITASMIGRKVGDVAGRAVDFARGYRRQQPAELPPVGGVTR